MSKKHEEFNKAFTEHKEKIAALKVLANQIIAKDHYVSKLIDDKRNQTWTLSALSNWKTFQTRRWILQQFSRDTDKIENWIAEKLHLATEESYLDSANIQSKHRKHQAFEAELAKNADKI